MCPWFDSRWYHKKTDHMIGFFLLKIKMWIWGSIQISGGVRFFKHIFGSIRISGGVRFFKHIF
ncbi:hypothetical protein BZG02_17655 [Labilibaculum filiforme]|uniref:Uncharacterized protein n=1 Tax=Labilibaculum filiforme TaxID=1940526 RepID=A0A2N3HRZ0_9BACT|nr:hypothetical protein BZG02_17655 [Labilibaculum filiforme]